MHKPLAYGVGMKQKPTQTMREFFSRADVKAQQEIQKRFHWTRPEHKKATAKIKALAVEIGAGEYFEDEE
jgi:hypothetical protein